MVQIPRLREWREARALTQVELAERAGVSSRSIAGYEAGAGARPPTVRKLADALGVEVGDLFPLEQPRLPELVPPGQAYFVPLEEGEEEDTVTLEIHFVRLFNGDEPILQAVRKASPDEVAAMRRELEKTGRSRE